MLQFALFFVFAWGIAFPTRVPDASRVATMPGEWSDVAPSLDQLFIDSVQVLPLLRNFGLRVGFITYAWLMIFWVSVAVSFFLFLVPFAGAIVLFFCFGVVPTVMWTWTLLLAVMILVSACSTLLPFVWVDSTYVVFNTLMTSVEHQDKIHDQLELIVKSVVAASTELNFQHFKHRGRVYVASDLNLVFAEDPAMAGALASLFMYCPVPREGLSSTAGSLLLLSLYLMKKFYSALKLYLKTWWITFKVCFVLIWFAFSASPRTLGLASDVITFFLSVLYYPFYLLFWRGGWSSARAFVRLAVLLFTVRVLNLAFRIQILSGKGLGDVKGFAPKVESMRSFWNNTIMDLTRLVDDIALPNFIRSIPDRMDVDAINETNQILASLGWPVAPEVTPEPNTAPANFGKYAANFLGNSGARQGVLNLQLSVAKELSNLAGLAPEYKRTEQYASVENELESLARYFEGPEVNIPDLPVEEVWAVVGDIFANSKLTPFSYILKKWEKSYGLNPFWRDPDSKKWRKLSRRKFIASIGGMGNMVRLWAKTFEVAPALVPVAGVSVKGEALPEKKWKYDLVRTIISSPLVHYISSTMWNYFPNHNFKFWSTNIKIGMPLNGANLSTLVAQHHTYGNHFAGDFSAFDSTIVEKVGKIVAAVRKKGFERHRDYAKICFLIDANYKVLQRTPMLTTSTGNIYTKLQGLSTGHSSTGMDNSLAVTIYYICAWKDLTGLSAHEFRHYNKLSNYGDDHILSYLSTAPASWTPSNIRKSMAKFGVVLRDEEPSHDLLQMEFLSKQWRVPTSTDRMEMQRAGVTCPQFVVFHNARKLVGKAYAPSKDTKVDRNYRVKRLISYLYLTAHHKDLYEKIVYDIDLIRTTRAGRLLPPPAPIPTYDEVLRRWYDPNSVVLEEDSEIEQEEIIDYSMSGLADTLVNILSVIPDIVNPAIYNMGYTTYLTSLFSDCVSWPVELIRRSNSATTQVHLVATLKKTCYDFLADNPGVTNAVFISSDGGLLLRHWIYIALRGPNWTPKAVQFGSWFDKKIGDFNFLLNGYVQTTTRRLDFPVLQILLISALAFIPDVTLPEFIKYVRLPTISFMVEAAYGIILNKFWASVPANMKQANAALGKIGPEEPFVLIEAPTGTGKSTVLVNFIWRYHAHRFNRFIVVVPRQLLVLTLTPYLRTAFQLPAHAVTEGQPYDESFRLIITTPGEVLLHEEWMTEGNLFQIDESHVTEPLVMGLLRAFDRMRVPAVLTTATPSDQNLEMVNVHVPLQIASTWKVIDTAWETIKCDPDLTFNNYWLDYRGRVISLARSQLLSKLLIFVVDVSHATQLASRIGRRCCILSSTHKEIDPEAEVFIATSVANIGLTIPDVDMVITSNIERKLVRERKRSTVKLVEIDPAVAKQRRGRTGRTNNGLFTMIKYVGAPFVHADADWDDFSIGISLLQSGVPPSSIARFFPGSITALWGKEYDRGMDKTIDAFVSQVSTFRDALQANHQRTFKSTEDGVDYGSLWTIQGNTIPVAQTDPNDPNVAAKMTADVMFDFIIGSSKWMVDRGYSVKLDDLITYFRTEWVSSATFKEAWETGKFGERLSQRDMTDADPTGRFGRRGPPTRRKAASDLMSHFTTFGKLP